MSGARIARRDRRRLRLAGKGLDLGNQLLGKRADGGSRPDWPVGLAHNRKPAGQGLDGDFGAALGERTAHDTGIL